jgi:hypothetical protein
MKNYKLIQAQKMVEDLISKTPTGKLRNDLTDINILLSVGLNELDEMFNEFVKDFESYKERWNEQKIE